MYDASKDWLLAVGIVLGVFLAVIAAGKVSYNTGYYVPSSCSGSCTGYSPSQYAPGSATAAGAGGVLIGAVIAVVCAYYYGIRAPARRQAEAARRTSHGAATSWPAVPAPPQPPEPPQFPPGAG